MRIGILVLVLLPGGTLLSGCGAPYVTVADGAGRPVMLPGHDPVADLTEGRAARGSVQHVVDPPARRAYRALAAATILASSSPLL